MCANESSTNTSIQDSSSSNGDDAPVPPSSSANEDEAAAKDAAPAATSVATGRPRRRATPEEPIYTQAREPRPSPPASRSNPPRDGRLQWILSIGRPSTARRVAASSQRRSAEAARDTSQLNPAATLRSSPLDSVAELRPPQAPARRHARLRAPVTRRREEVTHILMLAARAPPAPPSSGVPAGRPRAVSPGL